MGLLFLEATGEDDDFILRVRSALNARHDVEYHVHVVGDERSVERAARLASRVLGDCAGLSFEGKCGSPDWRHLLARLGSKAVSFLPANSTFTMPKWQLMEGGSDNLSPWAFDVAFPTQTCREYDLPVEGWIMSAALAQSTLTIRPDPADWRLPAIYRTLRSRNANVRWFSGEVDDSEETFVGAVSASRLTRRSSVLAVVPHFNCQPWLQQSLQSLMVQTRGPDGIVVIDDASPQPPVGICEAFPEVSLLRSDENVGWCRILQTVIQRSAYDSYLIQDADDWSCCDRLERLLLAAERTGAELVGTQELRVEEEPLRVRPVCYPLDVNASAKEKPRHPLLHPTTLMSRDLVVRLGGLSGGLRFSGDTEFLYRAIFATRIVNVNAFSYFRRHRAGALTTHPETGLDSPARKRLLQRLYDRAAQNKQRQANGKPPLLGPMSPVGPVPLRHLAGPRPAWL